MFSVTTKTTLTSFYNGHFYSTESFFFVKHVDFYERIGWRCSWNWKDWHNLLSICSQFFMFFYLASFLELKLSSSYSSYYNFIQLPVFWAEHSLLPLKQVPHAVSSCWQSSSSTQAPSIVLNVNQEQFATPSQKSLHELAPSATVSSTKIPWHCPWTQQGTPETN